MVIGHPYKNDISERWWLGGSNHNCLVCLATLPPQGLALTVARSSVAVVFSIQTFFARKMLKLRGIFEKTLRIL